MDHFITSVFSQLNVNTVLVIVAGVIIIYKQYKNDAVKVSAEVIAAYKIQVEQYKEEVAKLRSDLSETSHKMGTQDGIIAEKNKQIEDYKLLIANRNPALENILSEVVLFMKKIDQRLGFSETELKKQTKLLEQEDEK
ncbi:MAG: hypothetical protein V4469_04580 [Patescibacteria group bacterium]